MTFDGMFGEEELSVESNIKHSVAGGDEHDLGQGWARRLAAPVPNQLGRQTDGQRCVVSLHTKRDFDGHGNIVEKGRSSLPEWERPMEPNDDGQQATMHPAGPFFG